MAGARRNRGNKKGNGNGRPPTSPAKPSGIRKARRWEAPAFDTSRIMPASPPPRPTTNRSTAPFTQPGAPVSQTTASTNQSTVQVNQTNASATNTTTRNRDFTNDVINHPTLFNLIDPESFLRQARSRRQTVRRRPNRTPAPAPTPVVPRSQPAHPPQTNGHNEPASEVVHDVPPAEDEPVASEPPTTSQPEQESAAPQRVTRKTSSDQRRKNSAQVAAEVEAKKREEAAKQKAAEEQAKKDADAREAAARVKLAEQQRQEAAAREKLARERAERLEALRIEAAQVKAAREKKAAEEQAAQEKKAAEEKAAEEKAAQEKKAAEAKKAREEAAKERVAQKKAALVKAADENKAHEKEAQEQAAREKAAEAKTAQVKAAREEAAKLKAASEKAADERAAREWAAKETEKRSTMDHSGTKQAKNAEWSAKEEKQRKEKDERAKAAEELDKKEAAGFKRPRTKRPAPEPETEFDDANKKAKVDDKSPCKAFENGLMLANIKLKYNNGHEEDLDGPLKLGYHLNLDIIVQALASVTEAINDANAEAGQPPIFSLFHPRSLVDHSPLEHPVARQLHEALVAIRRSKRHFALVALVPTGQYVDPGHFPEFAMHHYDSDARLRGIFESTILKESVRSAIMNAEWAGSKDIKRMKNILGEARTMDACDRPADQEWTSGVHTILNGWVCALGLKHNKHALLSKEGFYEKAIESINLALCGAMSSQTIIDFFDCYEYVLPHLDDQSDDVSQRRRFRETRDFETFARLDTYIMRLFGRPARRDIDAAMAPHSRRSSTQSGPARSTGTTPNSASGNAPNTAINAFLRGVEGPAGLPNLEPEEAETRVNINDGIRDNSQPTDTRMRESKDEEEQDEADADAVDNEDEEEDTVDNVDELRRTWDGREREPTPVFSAEQAAHTAAVARERLQERQRQEAARAVTRERSAEPNDPEEDSLFDEDIDTHDFFGNNEAAPNTEARTPGLTTQLALPPPVAADGEEDLYSSSLPRHRKPPPATSGSNLSGLTPVAREEEEDLYSSSIPRNGNLPPTAPALNLPGPPPPTPHDPPTNTNNRPFDIPSLQFLNSPTYQQFTTLNQSQHNTDPSFAPPAPQRQTNPGFRVPDMNSSSSAGSQQQTDPAFRVPSLPSDSPDFPNPHRQTNPGIRVPDLSSSSADSTGETRQTNPGFRVPDFSSASSAGSNDTHRNTPAPQPSIVTNPSGTFRVPDISPVSSANSNDASRNPTARQPRPAAVTNPSGDFRVPDTPSSSSEGHENHAGAGPVDRAMANDPIEPVDQSNSEILNEAWNAGFGPGEQDAGLEAAMQEYDPQQFDDNLYDPAGQTPPGPYGFDDDLDGGSGQLVRLDQGAAGEDVEGEYEEGEGGEGRERGEGEYGGEGQYEERYEGQDAGGFEGGHEGGYGGDYGDGYEYGGGYAEGDYYGRGDDDNDDEEGEEGEGEEGDGEEREGEEDEEEETYGHGRVEEQDPDGETSQVFDEGEDDEEDDEIDYGEDDEE